MKFIDNKYLLVCALWASLYMDAFITWIGVHKYGTVSEANPLITYAYQNTSFIIPLVSGFLLFILSYLLLHVWDKSPRKIKKFYWIMLILHSLVSWIAWTWVFLNV